MGRCPLQTRDTVHCAYGFPTVSRQGLLSLQAPTHLSPLSKPVRIHPVRPCLPLDPTSKDVALGLRPHLSPRLP